MDPGKLDRRVSVLTRTTAPDEQSGEPIESWVVSFARWASKTDLSGSELFRAQQVNAEITTKFVFRYTDQITPDNRLRFGGKDYDIFSAAEKGRREHLEVLAKARVQ
jgi:SPP1 family predicted phage head-tail adaptor